MVCLAGAAPPADAYKLAKVGDFDRPVYVDNAPGAPNLLFVVEQDGVIRVVRNGNTKARPFLDIRSRVSRLGGEEGLLSVAFDPDYANNRRFYVYYNTDSRCDNSGACDIEVDGFRRSPGHPARASVKSREKVIRIRHRQQGNHNGGQLQFGPDGDLYLAPGDGGTQGDPENDAQRTDNLLGKLLRIDPRPGGGYTVPADNPFVGVAGKDEIFAIGLRNPWRFSFDSQTGDIWIGDVGWTDWEEVDHSSDANGANFGWNAFEGPDPCGDCNPDPAGPPYVSPVFSYPHSDPGGGAPHGCAITGGYVAHDPDLPALDGYYLYSDYCEGKVRDFSSSDPGTSIPLGLSLSSPSSFGEGAGGQIYVVSLDGRVYRLEPGT